MRRTAKAAVSEPAPIGTADVAGRERFEIGGYYLDQPHPDRGGSFYACQYDRGAGIVRRRSLRTADLEEAKVKLAALVLSAPAGSSATVPGPDAVLTVAALANYIDGHATTIRSEDDAIRAGELAKQYLEHVKKPMAPVSFWTPSRQLDFAKWLHETFKHKPASIERRLDVICAAFHEMTQVKLRVDPFGQQIETALMTHAPKFVYKRARIAKDLKIAPSKPRHNTLTIDDMAKVIDALKDEHQFRFAILSLNTWARPEAVMDFEPATQRSGGLIDLNPPGRVETNKRRSRIPETRCLAGWLNHWAVVDVAARETAIAAGREPPPAALLVYQGERVASVKKGLVAQASKVGIKFSPGRYRHFMSTMVRRLCRSVTREQRSIWMGHVVREGSQTTSNYEAEDPEFLEDVALATDFVMQQLQLKCQRRLFSIEVRLNRGELSRIGARSPTKLQQVQ
ncbi:hypothetical protein [Bradyrhizobium sp. CCBAU 25338]|uniref:hypothetical protein n=1 Tax=Bradyrhizobium sp. CCBAU 25338 TaxID=1641877 RepID=UPI002302935A|nr:hypothetical protein [Bradyrhizobium sp. CCBAU 25338]MDA9530347.1 hypothetical protein [Bradyrhizobium sp. CCBAU 25338]